MSWGRSFFGFVLYLSVFFFMVSFPHVFTYRAGVFTSLAFFLMAFLGTFSRNHRLFDRTGFQRSLRVLDRSFPLLTLLGIASFAVAILNLRFYSTEPGLHVFQPMDLTLGGVIPKTDNRTYLFAVLNFLKYGELNGQANFRPLGHLFNAFLLKMAGGDLIRFFQLSTALLILAVWCHGLIMARHLGRFAALASVWMLCWYFGYFQATFMTELTGGFFGILAIALLLHGLFLRSLGFYVSGMCLFALAMHIRTGVLLFMPAMAVVGAIRFDGMFRGRIYAFVSLALLLAASYVTPYLQYGLFQNEVRSSANFGEYAYRIQKNSDYWPYNKAFPLQSVDGRLETLDDRVERVTSKIVGGILDDPWTFANNYLAMTARYSLKPERFLFPWIWKMPSLLAVFAFLSFLSGYWLYGKGTRQRMLLGVLLVYLFCSLVSIPVLDFVKDRNYAASVSLNALMLAVAMQNLFLWASKLIKSRGISRPTPAFDSTDMPPANNGPFTMDSFSRMMIPLPVLLVLAALPGPLVVDRSRTAPEPLRQSSGRWEKEPGTAVEVILMQGTPFMRLFVDRDFKVEDPCEIPRRKWRGGWPAGDTLQGGNYWIPSSNLLDLGLRKVIAKTLFMPDDMLGDTRLSDIDTLVVAIDTLNRNNKTGFRYKTVRKVLYFTKLPGR